MNTRLVGQGKDARLIVTLGRKLDALNAPEIAADLRPFLSAGGRRVIFDCSSLEYASSAGLREFITAAKELKSLGGSCAFAALTPAVSDLFSLSGLTGLLEVHESVAAAERIAPPTAAPAQAHAVAHSAHDLTLTEEVVLLALDDKTGRWLNLPYAAFDYMMAGAVMADLGLAGKIDTDLNSVTVVDPTPTGDELLDRWLKQMADAPKKLSVAEWLRELMQDSGGIRDAALDRLVQKGVLHREEKRILWAIALRRYPTINGRERVEVRTRLRDLILGDELPDARDAMLFSLLHGCGLLEVLFGSAECAQRSERIRQLGKMDLVGRSAGLATDEALEMLGRALASSGF